MIRHGNAPEPPELLALPSGIPAARLPNWNLVGRVRRACPACGLDSSEGICRRPDGLVAARCPRCRMVYLPEIPSPQSLNEFYAHYAKWKGYANGPSKMGPVRSALGALRDTNVRILEESGGLVGRRLLEIGSSYGHFLERARWRGAQVTAVEADEDARTYLSSRRIEALADVPHARQFDIVCAFQLLEHLANPGALLNELAECLVRDGRLLIGVPNGGEVDAVGAHWVGFRVDLEHLNYFSVESLSRLLAKSGLFLEQFWLTAQPGIARPSAAAPPMQSARARLLLLGTALAGRLFESTRQARQGTYVLTVLARKG